MPEDRAIPRIDLFLVFPLTDDEADIDDINWDHVYLGDSPADPETIALFGPDEPICEDIDFVEIIFGEEWAKMIRMMDLIEAIVTGRTPCGCPKCIALMDEAEELAKETPQDKDASTIAPEVH